MDLFSIYNWKIISHKEEKTRFFLVARQDSTITKCRKCSASADCLYKFGRRRKTIKDSPIHGKAVVIELSVQRYKCLFCQKTFTAKVNGIAKKLRITETVSKGVKLTKRLVSYIKRQSVDKPFLVVSKETGVDENTVREIFNCFGSQIQKRFTPVTPVVMGLDDVYIGTEYGGVKRKARCIITDVERRRFVELLPKRDMLTLTAYLISLKDKEKIKIVTMDMWDPFRQVVEDILPNAKIVIDKYHVQRMGNQAVNLFLKIVRTSLNSSQRKEYLRDRFLLLKRSYKLSVKERERLEEWNEILPGLGMIYNLKEEFLEIWHTYDRKKAEESYEMWKNSIPSKFKFIFKEIFTAFENWHKEIFNYFDHRVTNAFTESTNNLIKMIRKQTRGCSYEVVRAKLLCKTLLLPGKNVKEKFSIKPKNYIFVPKPSERIKRLKDTRLQGSKSFVLMTPPEGWLERFSHHLHLLHKH